MCLFKEQVHLKIAKTLFYQLTGEFLLLMCFANSVQSLTEILSHHEITSRFILLIDGAMAVIPASSSEQLAMFIRLI